MKYKCIKFDTCRFYSVKNDSNQNVTIDEGDIFEIKELVKPVCKYSYELEFEITIKDEKYLITKKEKEDYFEKLVVTHYVTEQFTSINAMNDYLQDIPVKEIKDIKMGNDNTYLVMRIIKGND